MSGGSQWYYVEGNDRKGPLSADQMAALQSAGVIDDATLVWTDGMAGWAPLADTPLRSGPDFPPVPGAAPYANAGPGDAYDQPVSSLREAVTTCFQKYVTFSGRANRPEFWWFMLFIWLGGIVASIADSAVLGDRGILSFIFGLGVLLPSIAVTVRRLHDTDRSGWWYFLSLIPLVGIIILIVWFCSRGTQGRNRFG